MDPKVKRLRHQRRLNDLLSEVLLRSPEFRRHKDGLRIIGRHLTVTESL